MLLTPTEPQLTPVVRHRLKEIYPELQDEDLPPIAVSEVELIARIAARTHAPFRAIRRVLHEVGAFVPHVARHHRINGTAALPEAKSTDSAGSGIPEDTGVSGTSGLGSTW